MLPPPPPPTVHVAECPLRVRVWRLAAEIARDYEAAGGAATGA